jgi:hypothetical protein
MPTKASRARRMVNQHLATPHWSDLGIYYIRLIAEPSDNITQDIAHGVDHNKYIKSI